MDEVNQPGQRSTYAPGTIVIAENGQRIGTIRVVYPHFLLVREDGAPQLDLEVPAHAIARLDAGKLYLTVNREALSAIDDEESVTRQHPEQR